jgi:predicted nucleic acid-binding protein
MLFIIGNVNEGLIAGVSATIALTEVLVQPLRVGNYTLAQQYETVLTKSRGFRLKPITNDVARQAANLRARHNLRMADALHIAVGIDAGCDAFLTNDMGLKRLKEIPVLVLDELELDPPMP